MMSLTNFTENIYRGLGKLVDKVYFLTSSDFDIPEFNVLKYKFNSTFDKIAYFKKYAIIEAINDAYIKKYESIIVLNDSIYFHKDTDFITKEIQSISSDYCILNKDDINEDCIYFNRKAIEYIYYLNINPSNPDWLTSFEHSLNSLNKGYTQPIVHHYIDYVVTYVNNKDPEWIASRSKYVPGAKENRFRDWDIMNYHLDLVEKNMPWIRNIYIVVSSRSQVTGLDIKNNRKVITHDMIMPTKYLPAFNSCAIELFLYNIPGMSEYWIYSNDDMLTIHSVQPSIFFNNGKIVNTYNNIIDDKTIYRKQCLNTFNLCKAEFKSDWIKKLKERDKKIKKLYHSPHAYLRSSGCHLWALFAKQLNSTVTLSRASNNVNQYIYGIYDYIIDNYEDRNSISNYVEIDNNFLNADLNNNCTFICFNDCVSKYNMDIIAYKNRLHSYLKECLAYVEPEKIKIDFVFPYVDNTDLNWKEAYKKYCPVNTNTWGTSDERFRSYDLLKYTFRSIAKNLPWINKVFMLVMSDSQVPAWVNRDNVNIVCHDKFIPAKFLPTFNSSTIEMFLARIPKLSNYFIYSNDDIYITQLLAPENFFINKIPVFKLSSRPVSETAPGDVLRMKDMSLINPEFDNSNVLITQHICTPQLLENIDFCYNKYTDEIFKSCTRFREDHNYNQYIYLYNLYKTGKFINKGIGPKLSTCIGKKYKFDRDYAKFKICCLNDSSMTEEDDLEKVRERLEKLFPNKSKYEL